MCRCWVYNKLTSYIIVEFIEYTHSFCRSQWCWDASERDNNSRIIKLQDSDQRSLSEHARGRIRFCAGRRESFTDHLWRWTHEQRPLHTRRARIQSIFHDGLNAANAGKFESVFLVSVHGPNGRRVRRFGWIAVRGIAALRLRAAVRGLLSVSVCRTRRVRHGLSVWTRFWKHLPLVSRLRVRHRLHGSSRSGTPSSGVSLQPTAVAQIPPAPNRNDHHQTGQVRGDI